MSRLGLALLVAITIGLGGCDDMASQPKRRGFEVKSGTATDWPLQPPAGTVARDEAKPSPPPVTLALLRRGRERYDIYCAPCHSRTGNGDGIIVERGFPRPPSYFNEELRRASTQHFYDVITNGHGVMFPYAARVAPPDRWAIIAYIRALQASASASLAEVPVEARPQLR